MKKILLFISCLVSFFCGSQSFNAIVYDITHPIFNNYNTSAHSLKFNSIKDTDLITSISSTTYKYVVDFTNIDSTSRDKLILSFEKIKYDKNGNVISFKGMQGYKTYNNEFSYDSKNRLVEVKNRYGEIIETFKYSSKLIKRFFHPNSFSFVSATNAKYKFNSDGQLIRKTRDGGVPEDIIYKYNSYGDVIYENDSGEETKYTYKYDDNGRMIYKNYTNEFRSRSSEYFYDENGTLTKQTDNDGEHIVDYYYEENNLIKEIYTKYLIKTYEIQYQYDSHSNWVQKVVKFYNGDLRPNSISIREIIYN